MDDDAVDMRDCVVAVEKILHYRFKDTTLLEKALTHSSYTKSESYERLEFVGDSALGLAITNYIYLAYPDGTPGCLSSVRAANISTEKLARVAVRHRLYMYVRHNAASLEDKVREFCEAVQEEDDTVVVYGGAMKAPKVLADIVEAVAAAVYLDEGFDLQKMWQVVVGLLEPLITLDMLIKERQPVTMLFDTCQKNGNSLDIKHQREGDKNIASVYIDGHLISCASSEQKEIAKLQAAKAALQKLALHGDKVDICSSLNESGEIEAAKQKLHEICGTEKWPKPIYSDKQVEEGVPAKRKAVFVKVNDLKPGTEGHNLTVKVVSSTTVLDKKSIRNAPAAAKTRIAECLIGDDTGSILFTARNQQVDLMKPGATVIIRNSKIDMFKGSMRLAVDKWGRIEVAEPAKFDVKEDNNLSLVEYELVNNEV